MATQEVGSADDMAQSSRGRRSVRVDVYASLENGAVKFDHRWKFEDKPGDPEKGGRIDLPRERTAYQLSFHLHDSSGKKLSFIDPCSEAMYVTVGTDCPKAAGNGGGQIEYNYGWEKHKLDVDDMNRGDPTLLAYTLRFDGEPGKQASDPTKQCPPYEYDPIIKNGGGN